MNAECIHKKQGRPHRLQVGTAVQRPRWTGLLPFLFLLLVPAGAGAQAGAAFDSVVVETGEPFMLHIAVQDVAGHPKDVDFSAWDSIFPPQNMLRQSGWLLEGDQWKNDFTLITFDSADLRLPPLTLHFHDGSTMETNPLTLSVAPTPYPSDPNDIADIADIHREPFSWTDALPWVLTVGGLCALAYLAWWLLKRRRQKVRSRSIQLPPHELALRELDALAKRGLWQQKQVKAYYEALTYIARQYLQQRFGVPALESVSDETLYRLQSTDFPQALLPVLATLLHTADRVKFAKGEPPEDYHESAWAAVRTLVEKTVPAPEEPENKPS